MDTDHDSRGVAGPPAGASPPDHRGSPSGPPAPWTWLGVWSGMAFLVFVLVAACHALFALYWSGEPLAVLDVQQGVVPVRFDSATRMPGPRISRVGPIDLDPGIAERGIRLPGGRGQRRKRGCAALH